MNFCRSFIYTTALPPVSLEAIAGSYLLFPAMEMERLRLQAVIDQFKTNTVKMRSRALSTGVSFSDSDSPIQAVIVPGNVRVREAAVHLRNRGMGVYPIYSPTVKPGTERLRVILHSYNTAEQVTVLAGELEKFLL